MSETIGAPHRREGPACPFCGSTDNEMVALFGSQLLTSQFYCHGCHTVFEAVRHGAEGPEGGRDLDVDEGSV